MMHDDKAYPRYCMAMLFMSLKYFNVLSFGSLSSNGMSFLKKNVDNGYINVMLQL